MKYQLGRASLSATLLLTITFSAPATGAEQPISKQSTNAVVRLEAQDKPKRIKKMTEAEIQRFVDAFADAWARRDGDAFLALWHPDGLLHYPFANRIVKGSELGMLTEIQKQGAPNLTWKLLGWTSRGNVVVIEWESSNRYGEQVITWRGVDRMTLEGGKIREEIVYTDTGPLQARRRGTTFEALLQLPD